MTIGLVGCSSNINLPSQEKNNQANLSANEILSPKSEVGVNLYVEEI